MLSCLFNMFGLFKKKDPKAELQKKYQELLQKSYNMSTKDRAASDKLRAEAEALADKIAAMD